MFFAVCGYPGFELFLAFLKALEVIHVFERPFKEFDLPSLQILLVGHAIFYSPLNVFIILFHLLFSCKWIELNILSWLLCWRSRLLGICRRILWDTKKLSRPIFFLPIIIQIDWTRWPSQVLDGISERLLRILSQNPTDTQLIKHKRIVQITVHLQVFKISSFHMLHLVYNVARRVIIYIVLRLGVPVAHLVMQIVISNIKSLLVCELVVFHTDFLEILAAWSSGIFWLVLALFFDCGRVFRG